VPRGPLTKVVLRCHLHFAACHGSPSVLQSETAWGRHVTATNSGDVDYRTLADFRQALRRFTNFSQKAAEDVGLTAQQHQALLAIKAEESLTIGELADRLMLRPHSATGLADRLVRLDLVQRRKSTSDKRRIELVVIERGQELLERLSGSHRDELRKMRPLLVNLLQRV
jgi:DNA-binding MarR family transcriptional regulator